MVQALRNKFKGKEPEIKQDIRSFGEYKAADNQGQKATLSWHQYCETIMDGEPFRYVTDAILKSDDELLKNLAIEITNLLLRQAMEIKDLKKELEDIKHADHLRLQTRKLEMIRLTEAVKCET